MRRRFRLRTLRPARSHEHGYWHGPDQSLVDLSSNDYLSLSNHPALVESAKQALDFLRLYLATPDKDAMANPP